MSDDSVRRRALELIRIGELHPTRIWLELFARGGEGTVADLERFLAGLDPISDSYALLLEITLNEIQEQ
ncbi:hypothetical protein J2T11_000514 [Paenarthrobacter nicotinovorans]|jgi:hypothetical protein|nr:hypothetical protein [Paenarthrobacter nicotinovorans]